MEFVKKFTPSDFQEKNFTPSISPHFNSFSKKKHKKWVKMEKFTPLAKILHCRRHWRDGQIPPLYDQHLNHRFTQPHQTSPGFLPPCPACSLPPLPILTSGHFTLYNGQVDYFLVLSNFSLWFLHIFERIMTRDSLGICQIFYTSKIPKKFKF